MPKPLIKVLVVEDSAVQRAFLVHMLKSEPGFAVIGTARNGEEAIAFLNENDPDVITMDINMPKIDGFETTRRIMESKPKPVVIVTATTNPKAVATTFRAMEAGAVAVLPLPPGAGHPEHEASRRELLQTVRLMSEVRVVKRWPKERMPSAAGVPAKDVSENRNIKVVAIGASTGGPPVIHTILSRLPRDLPVPILIVQHIAAGFVEGFVHWLAASTELPVRVARDGEPAEPGRIYGAPDHYHLGLSPHRVIRLSDAPPENGLRPSVSYLFRSLAAHSAESTLAILLTGMGKDGAAELLAIRDGGGTTIAQSAETCVVNGMPGEAVHLNAAMHILSPEKIAMILMRLVKK